MSDDSNDKSKSPDVKKTLKGGNTLSLKGGFDPNSFKQGLDSNNARGPVVEHKRRRRSKLQKTSDEQPSVKLSSVKENKKTKGLDDKAKKQSTPKRQSSGLTLSVAEIEARKKALSNAEVNTPEVSIETNINENEDGNEVVAIQDTNVNSVNESKEDNNVLKKDAPKDDVKKTRGPKIIGHLKPEEYRTPPKKTKREDKGATQSRSDERDRQNNNNKKETSYSNQKVQFSMPDNSEKQGRGGRFSRNKSISKDEMSELAAKSRKSSTQPKQRQRKLTITNAENADEVRSRSVASYRRRLDKQKKILHGDDEERAKVYREVIIPDMITVQELANRMSERSADVVKELMKLGVMATLSQSIDADTAQIIVETMGHSFKRVSESDIENIISQYKDAEDTLKPRAPVVTIMGHVDHGKTSLLDALRKTSVVSGEAGGITQHIGAYQVSLEDSRKVTFIDTPGHAAFSEMRARGASVTDIVILVVAADDGVMPQTIEAIKHAKSAEVPIIVAINKIDKPGADANRIRTELLQHEIIVESMSGEVMDVEVSAKEATNLDGLLETILLQAEILDLKANPDRFAEGTVVEAKLDKGKGAVATLLVQHGTIKIGDIIVAGAVWGRVRALINDLGNKVSQAGPSVPVSVLGLGDVPLAGDGFTVVENDSRAREITEYRVRKIKEKSSIATAKTLDNLMSKIKQSEVKSLPVIVKGDVQGSVEAIAAAFSKVGNDEVKIQIVYSSAGGITESDVNLAETAGGIVIGFNVRANSQARVLAEKNKIEIRYYSIIYDVIDDMKMALSGMLSPELRENYLGKAEILEVFNISKVGNVAGCRIVEGLARRSAKVRLIRDNVVIHEGILSTLRRFKDEVPEVKNGYECGMGFEKYHDIRKGDEIEVFEIQEIQRKLD